MDKVSRLHFPSPFLYSLLASDSYTWPRATITPPPLPTPTAAITTGVLIRSSRFGSFLFQIVSPHLESSCSYPLLRWFFRSCLFTFFLLFRRAWTISSAQELRPRLTPVLRYRCIDALQHRFQTYTKTMRIQARKNRIRNSLRTEIKPLEYEYNKCSGFNLKIYLRNLLDSLPLHPYRSNMLSFNKSVLATARLISFFCFYISFIRFSFFLLITFRNFNRDTLILAQTTSCDAHP